MKTLGLIFMAISAYSFYKYFQNQKILYPTHPPLIKLQEYLNCCGNKDNTTGREIIEHEDQRNRPLSNLEFSYGPGSTNAARFA